MSGSLIVTRHIASSLGSALAAPGRGDATPKFDYWAHIHDKRNVRMALAQKAAPAAFFAVSAFR